MKCLEPGHVYEVANVDGPGVQHIVFVRRRDARGELLDARRMPGILSQELLRVLIDRVRFLNDEDPCVEDVEIIHHLRGCLRLFEARAARRTIEKMPMPELVDGCPVCHHLLCSHGHVGDGERVWHEERGR